MDASDYSPSLGHIELTGCAAILTVVNHRNFLIQIFWIEIFVTMIIVFMAGGNQTLFEGSELNVDQWYQLLILNQSCFYAIYS
jgi:hypothetical protein